MAAAKMILPNARNKTTPMHSEENCFLLLNNELWARVVKQYLSGKMAIKNCNHFFLSKSNTKNLFLKTVVAVKLFSLKPTCMRKTHSRYWPMRITSLPIMRGKCWQPISESKCACSQIDLSGCYKRFIRWETKRMTKSMINFQTLISKKKFGQQLCD